MQNTIHDMDNLPEILTARESAKYLRISYNEFLIKCRAKIIPHFRISGQSARKSPILCRKESLDEWIQSKEMGGIQQTDNRSKIRRLK